MRILHVTHSCSRTAGGLFESVRGLIGSQLEHGISADVVCLNDHDLKVDISAWPSRVVRPFRNVGGSTYGASVGMVEFIRSSSYDVIHLHGIWNFAALAVRLGGQGFPLVVSPRGMLDKWILSRRSVVKSASMALIEGVLLKRAIVHALCDAEKDSVLSVCKPAGIFVAPNAIRLPQSSAPFAGARSDVFCFCFLGRLHQKKGLRLLIDALALLKRRSRRKFRLDVYGWGDERFRKELIEQVRQLDIRDVVSFRGPVQGTDKVRAFRESNAFILPSFSEGLPMAVLEAASYGLPILMTEECNLPEFFESGAAIKVSHNPENICNAMMDLLSVETNLVGDRAARLVAEKYTWDAILPAMKSGYEQASSVRVESGSY